LRHFLLVVVFLLTVLALGFAAIWFLFGRDPSEIKQAPGILIKDEPVQELALPVPLVNIAGWELVKMANYRIRARVLHVKRYYDDRSPLSPIDLTVGWGRMSDTAVISKLKISQSMRMFFYELEGDPPIPEPEIVSHSANIHMIPADVEVADWMHRIRTGQLIDLQGSLVSAQNGSLSWRSSLAKNDVGDTSGKLFYVTEARAFKNLKEFLAGESQSAANHDLQNWYDMLALRRRSLKIEDQEAIHAFNEEARRYMALAHPEVALPTPVTVTPLATAPAYPKPIQADTPVNISPVSTPEETPVPHYPPPSVPTPGITAPGHNSR